MDTAEIENILDRYGRNPSQIIAILHEIQDPERYLPEDHLRYVARQLRISASQIYHIATFYKAYSLKPRGKHQCNVCMGTACHVRGAPLVLEELERRLSIKVGDTTQDLEFSLNTVNCLGACALGPLVTVDAEYFGNMNPSKVQRMIKQITARAAGEVKLPEERTEMEAPEHAQGDKDEPAKIEDMPEKELMPQSAEEIPQEQPAKQPAPPAQYPKKKTTAAKKPARKRATPIRKKTHPARRTGGRT